jgi:hypothetical protein
LRGSLAGSAAEIAPPATSGRAVAMNFRRVGMDISLAGN